VNIPNGYYPKSLPFSGNRLEPCLRQTLNGRSQLLDPQGAFVLTNTDLLPEGGRHVTIDVNESTLLMHLVGDMGINNQLQHEIVSQIHDEILSDTNNAHNLVFGLGDWVYPSGPFDESASEVERVKETVLNQYEPLSKLSNLYGVLGNHEYGNKDHMGDPAIFMKIADDSGIKLPGRYYQMTLRAPEFDVEIFALDTSTLSVDEPQLVWFKDQLCKVVEAETQSPKKVWKMVVAHHPIQTSGHHMDENLFLSDLIKDQISDIDFYLAGHEHGIECLSRTTEYPYTIISGSGAESHPIETKKEADFGANNPGFVALDISGEEIVIKMMLQNEKGSWDRHSLLTI